MNTKLIIKFLKDLSENNTIDWMHQNKIYYQEAKMEFEQLLQELIFHIAEFDASVVGLEPKNLIFRLNRDTRFAKDKSPYNPSFRAHISIAERKPIPAGAYLNIKPNHCFLGGGVFATSFPEATTMVRDSIVANPTDFQSIIENSDFSAHFTVEGVKLKNVPNGYPKDFVLAEYLKHKSWDIEYPISDSQFEDSDSFIPLAIDMFKLMQPLNNFLNTALTNFSMPKR